MYFFVKYLICTLPTSVNKYNSNKVVLYSVLIWHTDVWGNFRWHSSSERLPTPGLECFSCVTLFICYFGSLLLFSLFHGYAGWLFKASCIHHRSFIIRFICFRSALWQTGDLPRVYPAFHPKTAGIGFSPPATLKRIGRREWLDGWMDVSDHVQRFRITQFN